MKRPTTFKQIILAVVFIISANLVKAQVSSLSDLQAGTLAAYCPTEQVKLTANNSTGAVSYIWKRYPGINTSGTATTLPGNTINLTDTPTDPGYYTYVSTGVNSDGCESEVSSPATVYVLPGITASIASSNASITKFCTGTLPAGGLTFTATAGEATSVPESFTYKYQWYRGTTAITGATNATYTLVNPDDTAVGANAYTVKVTYVIKACTEQTSNAINIDVLALPGKPTIVITP